ncbi:MAG: QsdR family transcriptional regulator [Pseudomarimonas sp.]
MSETTTGTRLSRELRSPLATKATPVDAFRLARGRWLAGERIDIGALASELGVSRATLFRWVGSRELLLAEILWSLCEPTMQRADSGLRLRGAARIARVCERVIRAILDFAPLRRFIAQDAEYALRLLTSKASPVQARTIAAVRDLLVTEVERGELSPPIALDTLAYLIVRLGESFVYAETISGQTVNVADAAVAIELLLSGQVSGRRL